MYVRKLSISEASFNSNVYMYTYVSIPHSIHTSLATAPPTLVSVSPNTREIDIQSEREREHKIYTHSIAQRRTKERTTTHHWLFLVSLAVQSRIPSGRPFFARELFLYVSLSLFFLRAIALRAVAL